MVDFGEFIDKNRGESSSSTHANLVADAGKVNQERGRRGDVAVDAGEGRFVLDRRSLFAGR